MSAETFQFQRRVSIVAARLRRRCPALHAHAALRVAETLLCAGADPLATRDLGDYYPHVCPDCHAVDAPCRPGCWEAEREARWSRDDWDDAPCACAGLGCIECEPEEAWS